MYSQPTFREGFALLEKHGLSFDAWVFSSQLPDVMDLALAFPGTTIVLNHAGTPLAGLGNVAVAPTYDGQQEDIMATWKVRMSHIAETCPNVYVKVGGAGVPQLGAGFEARAKPPSSEEVARVFKEMYLWTIETFGADRCMLEGNFPVDKVSMSYTVLWNALKKITRDLPDEDRALLFSGTAKKVYNL
jgi:predicted TIM-barrel fold metal-dependent hydrolase